MIVADSSAIAKYLLREEGWRSVEEYLVKGVYSLDLVVVEVANAIWKHSAVRKLISADLGLRLFQQLKRLVTEGVVKLENQLKYIDSAMDIALSRRVPIYDALFIAQALRYGELLTSDRDQARVASDLGVKVYLVD